MTDFTLTAATDTFTGTSGQQNRFIFTPSALQSIDRVTGGATGGFIDILLVTAGGAITAGQFVGVTNVEEIDLSAAGNSVTLTNGLVAGSSTGQFTIVDGGGDDSVDGSAVTNGVSLIFRAAAGNDTLRGGTANDIFFFATGDLTSADTVVGGAGVDTIWLTTAGFVPSSAFANTSGVEALVVGGAGSNLVALSDQLVGGSDTGQFVVTALGGNNTIDASLVTSTNAIIFNAGPGVDTLRGGAGRDSFVFTNAADLTAADSISGGANVDTIWFNGGGTVAASAFANVSGLEALVLSSQGSNITLSNSLVGGTSNGTFAIGDRGGNDVVDASGVTNNVPVLFFAAGGNDTFRGGNGTDAFVFATADLTAQDTIEGAAGTDNLFIVTGGTLASNALSNVSGIEALVLLGTNTNVTLTNNSVAGTSIGVFNVADGVGDDVVDASGVADTPIAFYAQTGNDTFRGGSGGDGFIFSASNLTSSDTVVAGAGFDVLSIVTNGTVTAANNSGVSQIEAVQLLAGGEFDFANTLSTTTLTGLGSAAVDRLDGTAVTAYSLTLVGGGGADTLIGGSQNDTIVVPDASFASIDGRGGADTVVVTTSGQVFDVSANASKIHNIEVLNLDNAANTSISVSLKGADLPLITSNNTLYVVGSANDAIAIDTGFTQQESGVTNNSIASTVGYTFVHWHHANGSDLYIAEDVIVSPTLPSGVQAPDIELGGFATANYATNYTTGNSAGTLIAASDAVIQDPDQATAPGAPGALIVRLDVAISNARSGGAEFLQLNTAGRAFLTSHPELTVTGENTQALRISGNAADSVYQTLLREIVYVNTDTSASLDTTARLITVNAQDGDGFSATGRTTTISVSQGNVAPTINGTSVLAGAVTEDVTLVANGSVVGNDANSDALTYAGDSGSSLGSFNVVESTGGWSYTLNNAAAQALTAGQTVTENYGVVVSDGHGGTANTTVTVTINGINDVAVVLGNAAGAVTEDVAVSGGNLTTSGALTVFDADAGQANFAPQTATVGNNGYGTFTLNAAGNWTYSANNGQSAIQQLGAGQSLTDSFTAVSSDGSASRVVTVTINGINDVAVVLGNAAGAVTEDVAVSGGNLTTSGALTVFDADAGQANFAPQTATVGNNGYGTFTLNAAGNWTYSANNGQSAIQQLGAGQSLTDSFTAVSSDGSASRVVTVTINGINDVAVVLGNAAGAVTEDVAVSGGNLTTSGALTVFDADAGQANFAPQTATVGNSGYGTFTLNAAGIWTYSANNGQSAIQQLGAGQSLTDSFTAVSSDGSASRVVTVTINGSNDAPVAATTGNTASGNEDTTITGSVPAGTDVDSTGLTYGLISGPSAAEGIPSFSSNGSFSFVPTANFNGPVDFTYRVNDPQGAHSDPQTFTITINPVNDAPVAATFTGSTNEDAPFNGALAAMDVEGSPLTFAITDAMGNSTAGACWRHAQSERHVHRAPAAGGSGTRRRHSQPPPSLSTSSPMTVRSIRPCRPRRSRFWALMTLRSPIPTLSRSPKTQRSDF